MSYIISNENVCVSKKYYKPLIYHIIYESLLKSLN